MKTVRFGLGLSIALATAALTGCHGSNEAPGSADAPKSEEQSVKPKVSERPAEAAATAAPAPPPAAPGAAEHAKGEKAEKGAGEGARRAAGAPQQPVDRPGLGTEWGETRQSRIDTVSFSRADAATPFATTGVFYNDEQGARGMASAAGFRRTESGPIPLANGTVTIGLRDERGRFLSGYSANSKDFVVGEAGQRYTIVLHNNTDLRFEAVMSVDGLDVMDGKDASFKKRGYIIDPRSDLEVDGFRQSTETVAAFRFGSVRNSYANQKHGETRNVGIIGVALFHERGTNPFIWINGDVSRREHANPFPGQYASPP